eukprot:2749988-Rhodomonas_salina.3
MGACSALEQMNVLTLSSFFASGKGEFRQGECNKTSGAVPTGRLRRESTEQPGCASIVQPALMQRRICRSKLIPGPSVTSRTRTSCGPQPKGQNCGSRACLHVQLRRSWKRETAAPLYNGVSSLPIKTLAPPIEALCMKYKIITIAHASEILVERCRHWTLKSSKYQTMRPAADSPLSQVGSRFKQDSASCTRCGTSWRARPVHQH